MMFAKTIRTWDWSTSRWMPLPLNVNGRLGMLWRFSWLFPSIFVDAKKLISGLINFCSSSQQIWAVGLLNRSSDRTTTLVFRKPTVSFALNMNWIAVVPKRIDGLNALRIHRIQYSFMYTNLSLCRCFRSVASSSSHDPTRRTNKIESTQYLLRAYGLWRPPLDHNPALVFINIQLQIVSLSCVGVVPLSCLASPRFDSWEIACVLGANLWAKIIEVSLRPECHKWFIKFSRYVDIETGLMINGK